MNSTLRDITAASNATIKKGDPVLLHVNFANPNQNAVEYLTMIKVNEKVNSYKNLNNKIVNRLGCE